MLTGIERKVGVSKYAGTYRIASEIQSNSVQCNIINHISSFSEKEIYRLLNKYVNAETLFVGLSSTLLRRGTNPHCFPDEVYSHIKEVIRSISPKCYLIIGGSRIGYSTKISGVDYYFVGKADKSIVAFINYIISDKDIKIRTGVDNQRYIDGNDYLVTSEDFSTLPIKYNLSDVSDQESLPIEVARGCIFQCSFCQFDLIGKKKLEYLRSEESLYQELIENYEKFKTTSYLVSDELINESLEKLQILVKVFNRLPFKIEWSAFARLDLIHAYPEMREIIYDLNPNALIFGVETLSKKAGIKARKGLGEYKIIKTLNYLKEKYENKVIMKGSFILGLPGETEADLRNTQKWLDSDNNPLDLYQYSALQITRKESTRIRSDIAKLPDKYGVDLNEELKTGGQALHWKTDDMSYKRALELQSEFQNTDEYISRCSLMPAHYFGAIQNLGYSTEEIKAAVFQKKTPSEATHILSQWSARTDVIINKYKDAVLA